MREIEVTGKTVDEALYKALKELGKEFHEIEFTILEESSKGFFGIGSKEAKVKVWEKAEEGKENIARKFLEELFEKFDVKIDISITKTKEDVDQLNINLRGKEAGLLIGKRGQTLDSVQYLVSLVINKSNKDEDESYTRVVMDIDGYRQKREETLRQLANRLAQKAKRNNEKVTLEPMNPQERRIIHTTLQEHPYVYTYSEGEDPYRYVVIEVK